jgi:hypothetical protein
MKTLSGSGLGWRWRTFVGLLAAVTLGAISATGQERTPAKDNAGSNGSDKAAATPAPGKAAPSQAAAPGVSTGVSEILRMADAGVSPDVLKAYLDSEATVPKVTDADIIALKQHQVPDEVTTLLLKRQGEARVAASKNRQEALQQLVAARRAVAGGLDRESYAYFQYYYLQPRAVASANQRLAPYSYYAYYPRFGHYPGYNTFNGFAPGFRPAPRRYYP